MRFRDSQGLLLIVWTVGSFFLESGVLSAQDPSTNDLKAKALEALRKGTQFFHKQVAVEGGYVYRVSSDLQHREGEGVADPMTVWVQPPGTPAVGQAYLDALERTGMEELRVAAHDAAHCLVRGQLHSGGWQAQIDFSEELRPKLAYRVDGPIKKKARNISSFDDDKTQSAVRFLIHYDRVTKMQDKVVHEAVHFALDSILLCQHTNGGFAQVFGERPESKVSNQSDVGPPMSAKYPADWPKAYPGGDYWWHLTLNDNNMSRTIETLFLAADVYGQERFHKAALRAADFLLLAQMPEPQPAWAQQYSDEMEPVWARKFEPPAISGGESQQVIKTLMQVYQRTNDIKYLEPIPKALDYLKRSERSDGKLARFYELRTNRPLYMTKTYELTYLDDDLPTHYGFVIRSDVDKLRKSFDKLRKSAGVKKAKETDVAKIENGTRPDENEVLRVIQTQDERGAWVDSGKLKYHKQAKVNQIIQSETFVHNLDVLSRYLAK